MKITQEKLNGKKILIWGYGREGKSTEKLLLEHCSPAQVDVYEGSRDGVHEDQYDYIFVSPGIKFEEEDPRFTSQTEVFLEEYAPQTVGITGTKGKSTTSSMLAHVLNACGRKAFLMGNIGKPSFDYIAEMDEDTIAVYELSCHQCQRLLVSPHIAVFLNLYEDHLDRYGTRAKYFEAKKGITRNQTQEDYLYLGEDVPELVTKAQRVLIGRRDISNITLRIPGDHNHLNAEFVYRIAVERFGCDPETVRTALGSFNGLPHRLEFAGNIEGIDYYDDSISTIPEATISAAKCVANAYTMLVGGMDRGIDYTILVDGIRRRSDLRFILMYASGKRILEDVKGLPNVMYEEDLAAALALARKITPRGKAVILSPAAASYGYFKNFEERGDYFKKVISSFGDNGPQK